MKDPTEFRKRFALWKNGEKPYENGLPKYLDGKDLQWDTFNYKIPYIPEKSIKLTNAGLATGARISTNMLDSLANAAEEIGLPIQTAIGLATKESTLGNPTDDRSMRTLLSAKHREDLEHELWKRGIRGKDQYGQHLVPDDTKTFYWDQLSLINYYNGERHMPDAFARKENVNNLPSTLKKGLLFYKDHPERYNPGQKNYQRLVDKRGAEVMLSPEVLKWLKERNIKKVTGRFNRLNPLLNESKLNPTKYKDGKLPGYKGGKLVLNNYTNAEFNDDGTFTDDTTRVFDDFYVTPSGVKTKYGSYTDKNWDRYKQQEQFFKTHDQQTGKLKYEPGLEIVSPEFDLLTGIRALMPTMNTMDRKAYRIAREMNNGLKKNPILGSQADKNQFAAFVDNLTVGTQKALYLAPRKTSTPTQISWEDAQKPLSAQLIFPNEAGEGWLKTTADRLGVNINHYYNNIITPEELMQSVKNNGWESFISGKTFTEPAYIPSGFPYGLDKSRILMPYDEIRKMPMMAKYANLPEAEFRKVADDLIGSHEFIHWWNRQLAKNIKSGRMKIPKGYLEYELTWTGENLPDGIDPDALGKTLGYMSEMNGTESNARLGQLFNAFGIKKGELRPQHINLALKFYRKVFPDNQMSIFLNAIKDKNALVKFANENAGTLFGTGTAVTAANKYAE